MYVNVWRKFQSYIDITCKYTKHYKQKFPKMYGVMPKPYLIPYMRICVRA